MDIKKLTPFFILALLLLFSCDKKKNVLIEDIPACGTVYDLSDVYFSDDDTLKFSVKMHFILRGEKYAIDTESIKKFFDLNNAFYKHAKIQFVDAGFCGIVDSEESINMPNFKKFAKVHGEPKSINIFVYNNYQPFYEGDRENTAGVTAAIGSNTIAIRENFLGTLTSTHELGHALGLYHLDRMTEVMDTTDFTGDLVRDTPPITNIAQKVSPLCIFVGKDTLNEKEQYIVSRNVMSWVYLHCREVITDVQIARIKWMIQNNKDLRDCIINLPPSEL